MWTQCELCKARQCTVPIVSWFSVVLCVQCEACKAVYHAQCKTRLVPCPRCARRHSSSSYRRSDPIERINFSFPSDQHLAASWSLIASIISRQNILSAVSEISRQEIRLNAHRCAAQVVSVHLRQFRPKFTLLLFFTPWSCEKFTKLPIFLVQGRLKSSMFISLESPPAVFITIHSLFLSATVFMLDYWIVTKIAHFERVTQF